MKTKEDLLDLKSQIDENKNRIAEAKGQLSYLMAELKTNFKCDSIKDAKVLIKERADKLSKLKIQKQKGIEALEKFMDSIDFDFNE